MLQVLLDATTLGHRLRWLARLAAPFGAVAISGGFFGLAFGAVFRWLVYLGAAGMAASPY